MAIFLWLWVSILVSASAAVPQGQAPDGPPPQDSPVTSASNSRPSVDLYRARPHPDDPPPQDSPVTSASNSRPSVDLYRARPHPEGPEPAGPTDLPPAEAFPPPPAITPPPRKSCMVDCAVHLPDYTGFEWVSYVVNTTITVATVETIVNPKFPNITSTKTWGKELPEGYTAPLMDSEGSLVAEVVLDRGPWGMTTTRVTYPNGLAEYPPSYLLSGTLETALSRGKYPLCMTATDRTFQLPDLMKSASVSAKFVLLADTVAMNADNNYVLMPKVNGVNIRAYQDLWPAEAAFRLCRRYESDHAVTPQERPVVFGPSWHTVSSTVTRTDKRPPYIPAVVKLEPTAASLDGPQDLVFVTMDGSLAAATARTEPPDPGGILAGGGGTPPLQAVRPTALPIVTKNPPDSVNAIITIGAKPVPITIQPPSITPGAAGPDSPIVFRIGGNQVATLGQTITVDNTPVAISAAPGGSGFVAVVGGGNPGSGGPPPQVIPLPMFPDTGSLPGMFPDWPGRVPNAAEYDMLSPALPPKLLGPIDIGNGIRLTPKGDATFVLPAGEVLVLGGPAVTVKARPGASGAAGKGGDTVLSLGTASDGGEVLVVNGVSRTLGVTPVPMPTAGGPAKPAPTAGAAKGDAGSWRLGRDGWRWRWWIWGFGVVVVRVW